MSDGLTVDTGGTGRLAASLGDAAAALADPAPLCDQVAQRVASDAAGSTPRATGALANSLRVTGGTREGKPAAVLTWGVRYAVFVNFGTRYMRARPFATDALAAVDAESLTLDWAESITTKVSA